VSDLFVVEQDKMAQLPRVIATAPQAASTTQTRSVAIGRVASISSSSVEEPGFSTATQLDTAPFAFHDRTLEHANDDRRQQGHKRQHFGLLNAPSVAFASIFEGGTETTNLDDFGNPVEQVFSGTVSKAIKTYELNHKVISGNNPVRGTEVSLTL
jgi:hypothetical protein